jgi:Phosphodiester glycosidase
VKAPSEAPEYSFEPAPATIPFPEVRAPGDGVWINVAPGENNLRKTLIHPDPARTWAELFVVAIDLTQVSLSWVPGLHEPESRAEDSDDYQRTGRIPSDVRSQVIAAFNGGFKTEHGKFGAQIDGITLVTPRPHLCTLAQTQDGQLLLGTYTALDTIQELRWLRQTPACMVENGDLHPGLAREDTKNWGATLDGGTVIRRSAIGISADRKTLFMGISNDTTARALALGMKSAGANTVAQLDVNQAYPKFVLFEKSAEKSTPRPLVEGFAFQKDQYLKAEGRDFFYLTKAH